MPSQELDGEIAAGVAFWGYEAERRAGGHHGRPAGARRRPDPSRLCLTRQPGAGRRRALLEHLTRSATRRMLVGTWAAADRAISFYRRHGFEQVSPERTSALLKTYWAIPDRQIETSVVLANPPLDAGL